jgi:WD40 repeat protein
VPRQVPPEQLIAQKTVTLPAGLPAVLVLDKENRARVCDVLTGKPLSPALPHDAPVRQAEFEVGKLLTVTTRGTAQGWDVAKGTKVGPAVRPEEGIERATWFGGDRFLTYGGAEGVVRVWEAATGKALGTAIKLGEPVTHYDRAGSHVVLGGKKGTVRLWEVPTGRPLTPPLKLGDEVTLVRFSYHSKFILSASKDGTARVWRTSGEALTPPLKHGGPVHCAIFDPDPSLTVDGPPRDPK